MRARAYTVSTDAPEADGTFAWDKTTIIVVHIETGGEIGLAYSDTDASVARLIVGTLASRLTGLPILFDRAPVPRDGAIFPDLTRPGHGLTLKTRDADASAV